MTRENYYDKAEIKLKEVVPNEGILEWSQRITSHELSGLELMGCCVENKESGLISTYHDNRIVFFNRTIGVSIDNVPLANVEPLPREVIVSSFIKKPKKVELYLENTGWDHTLSSIILVTRLDSKLQAPDVSFRFEDVKSDTNFKEGFSVFSSFFMKPDEALSDTRSRFSHNVKHGPHKVAFRETEPIAMVGSIVIGDTATIYSGIVDNRYRNTKLLDAMLCCLNGSLISEGVSYIYMKTRNRAVSLYAQRFYGVEHIYNERVYEKKEKKSSSA